MMIGKRFQRVPTKNRTGLMGIDFIHREWHERLDHIKWNMPGSLFLFDLVIYNIQLVNLIGRVFLFSAIEEPVVSFV